MANTRYGVWQELRVIRHRSLATLTQLSAETGLSVQYLSMLETGARWPTPGVIQKLATALKVPYTMLERPADQKTGEGAA